MEIEDEKAIRSYVKQLDEKVIRRYFSEHPDIIEDAINKQPTKEWVYDTTTNIRCFTGIDVTTHRVLKILTELMRAKKEENANTRTV